MMINKRLIGTVPESKRYVAGNVILQWCSLLANIAMMTAITRLLAALYLNAADGAIPTETGLTALCAVVIRFFCTTGSARMGYLSSRAVKRTLRAAIYEKLLRLGASYNEQVKTSEIVQVAVEGVDQLETYFGAYLPQFFYAMLAPVTLFAVLCRVNLPASLVLLVCVPLIPVAIAAVQTWAKKLLSKYWGQYTALGDTFLENLQGLTTLKIYQAAPVPGAVPRARAGDEAGPGAAVGGRILRGDAGRGRLVPRRAQRVLDQLAGRHDALRHDDAAACLRAGAGLCAGLGGDEGRDGADPTAGRVCGLPTEKCVSCVRRDVRDGDGAL